MKMGSLHTRLTGQLKERTRFSPVDRRSIEVSAKRLALLAIVATAFLNATLAADKPRVIFKSLKEVEQAAFAPTPKASSQIRTSSANPSDNLSGASVAAFIQNLDSRFAGLKNMESNPVAFAKEIAAIQLQIASKQAELFRQVQRVAYEQYGVPELEKSLQENKRLDRNAPGYFQKYGAADSDETAAVRSMLMDARTAATGSIPSLLKGNGDYQALQAYADTLTQLNEQVQSKRFRQDGERSGQSYQAGPKKYSQGNTPKTTQMPNGQPNSVSIGHQSKRQPSLAEANSPPITGMTSEGFRQDAYGLGVHANQYGLPVTVRPIHGGGQGELLQVNPNAYGLGMHSDQYGRPLQEVPFGR
jgi:hypothetical protein